MVLQSDVAPANHIIAIEKCNIFEDGFYFACSKKLDTGSALQVDSSQNHNTEFDPGCPVWHCLGCLEPNSPLITQHFWRTHDINLLLSRFVNAIRNATSGWSALEYKDRLKVIDHIF